MLYFNHEREEWAARNFTLGELDDVNEVRVT